VPVIALVLAFVVNPSGVSDAPDFDYDYEQEHEHEHEELDGLA
jgi:hypothetical protein